VRYENAVLWTDVFLNVFTRLVSIDEISFEAEKWHFTLHFELDQRTGQAVAFTIGGRDIDYLKVVGMKAWKVKERTG
jgi:hypothetical protein